MPQFDDKNMEETKSSLIYQHADGTYLPDSSQPDKNSAYDIKSNQYTPHKSTRYINVAIGENGKAKRMGSEENLVEEDKDLPELYEDRVNCCGCTACYAICPVQAIIMRPDEEGFLYPVVSAEKCVRCYNCLSVCVFKEAQSNKGYL